MNLEQAITTAIDYEGKVYKTYLDAIEGATDEVGKRVFQTLCDEEKGHLAYLRERLEEWRETGTVTPAKLDTVVPPREALQEAVAKLTERVAGPGDRRHDNELEMLRRALKVEVETSAFYQEMVETLDSEGRQLFERFVEIEEGHKAIVQAEIDCLSGAGFWFDTREISLEL